MELLETNRKFWTGLPNLGTLSHLGTQKKHNALVLLKEWGVGQEETWF